MDTTGPMYMCIVLLYFNCLPIPLEVAYSLLLVVVLHYGLCAPFTTQPHVMLTTGFCLAGFSKG